MIHSRYLTFTLLILSLTSAQTSTHRVRSTFTDKESNKQERIDIDLNKPYIPEHSSTTISSSSKESGSKHSTKETQHQPRDQGETAYRAHLDKKNQQRRIRRKVKKVFGDEKHFKDKLPINSKTIKEARKNIREGKATEEEIQIIQRRKKIEAKSRKKYPEIQRRKGQNIAVFRERVRKGIAEPHELNKILKIQARDRLYQHKRYLRKKAETSASKSPK